MPARCCFNAFSKDETSNFLKCHRCKNKYRFIPDATHRGRAVVAYIVQPATHEITIVFDKAWLTGAYNADYSATPSPDATVQ
jgi:hypothetical protein